MSTKHTPTPWEAKETAAGKGKVVDSNGFSICNTTAGPYDQQRADAAHIVRCVNAHDGLVEALRNFVSDCNLTERERLEVARAALKSAGES